MSLSLLLLLLRLVVPHIVLRLHCHRRSDVDELLRFSLPQQRLYLVLLVLVDDIWQWPIVLLSSPLHLAGRVALHLLDVKRLVQPCVLLGQAQPHVDAAVRHARDVKGPT